MRVVVQRVARAAVRRAGVEPPLESRIGPGLVLLAGFRPEDDVAALRWMAAKCLGLRLFADESGAMNRSLQDVGGSILAIPNFTLYGDASKGRRPSFTAAAPPERAAALFDAFLSELRRGPVPVEAGFFQTHMQIELVNDGPVTLWLER